MVGIEKTMRQQSGCDYMDILFMVLMVSIGVIIGELVFRCYFKYKEKRRG